MRLVFLLLTSGLVALFQDPSTPNSDHVDVQLKKHAALDKRAHDERFAAKARRALITTELEAPDLPSWAGQYSLGVRSSVNIWIAPKNGLVYLRAYDVGGSDRWNHGPIVLVTDHRIEVDFALPLDAISEWNNEEFTPSLSRTFVFIAWGDRDYLVPENEMIEFCNVVNDKSEWWKRRMGNHQFPCKAARGRPAVEDPDRVPTPDIPAEYRKYLLDREVTTTAFAVGRPFPLTVLPDREPTYAILVTVDAGRNRGVETGMVLHMTGPHDLYSGEVLDVGNTTCHILINVGQWSEDTDKGVHTGVKLSTVRPMPGYMKELIQIQGR